MSTLLFSWPKAHDQNQTRTQEVVMSFKSLFAIPFFLLSFILINGSMVSDAFAQNSFINKIGMKFVLIPAGSFIMGSPDSEKGRQRDEKQHRLIISKSF